MVAVEAQVEVLLAFFRCQCRRAHLWSPGGAAGWVWVGWRCAPHCWSLRVDPGLSWWCWAPPVTPWWDGHHASCGGGSPASMPGWSLGLHGAPASYCSPSCMCWSLAWLAPPAPWALRPLGHGCFTWAFPPALAGVEAWLPSGFVASGFCALVGLRSRGFVPAGLVLLWDFVMGSRPRYDVRPKINTLTYMYSHTQNNAMFVVSQ